MKARFHLPGLFEFNELYRIFLPLFDERREFFYDFVEIGSIYGAPADCIWGGGRVGFGDDEIEPFINLLEKHNISARLTFSNSLLTEEHLLDRKCNKLCAMLNDSKVRNGVIVYSDILVKYLKENYPDLYLVSSTTKVLTIFEELRRELNREEFKYVVPDFRLNKNFEKLNSLPEEEKNKVEFLCNECCYVECTDRKKCYENVSMKSLGIDCEEHICRAPGSADGYRFSKAMKNPMFIGIDDIKNIYLPMGFTNFKIEGRGLGSAIVLEFLLHYLVKPEYQLEVRELIYLDSSLDLF